MFSHVRNIGLYAELQRHPLVNSARQCARRLFKYRDCSLKVFQSPLFPSMLSYAEAGLVAATVGSSAYLFYREKLARASKLPLPPSPAGAYPLLGHALALPTSNEHLTYSKWSRELKSDIISMTALGQTIVVLNSVEAAIDLMDRRSAIYSDRPELRVIADPDLLDWSYVIVACKYGSSWKRQRRMIHDVVKTSTNEHHYALMERETRAMLKRLLENSEDIEKKLRGAFAAEIMSTVYGYSVTGIDDPFVRAAQTGVDNFCRAALPANFLVNLIPWLKYVPDWFPGAGWKQTIKEWRRQKDEMVQAPYDWAKSDIATGSAPPSMIKTHLAQMANNPNLNLAEEEHNLKWAASALFSAATDTTDSSSMTFVLAMVQHPEIQARAQEEIDSITHAERLPSIADMESMPYMRRIVQEVLRWQPALPLGITRSCIDNPDDETNAFMRIGVPHASTKDDEYRGYFIPKGSIVMANAWAMTRDESVYKDPNTFNPDRFLDPSVPSPPAFGFGRRICPGNHYAEASMFIMFASILAAFNIKPKVDPATGREMIPETKVSTSALVSHPLPFDYVIKPRSDSHKELVGFA
ncbi:O-methylsterigmatocystin oxidoreductase [Ceratobasidium theobromae]|uniref:O-methylsterigmatocystin oxidoreductase n=1 Tax=Ceratobasidium theobromae TaxID=1582974 RepID=A0A5N5QH66_9AGAM|nr:O-methylsterigmatocystin oxidoreductase [Ceratobasidium theobromae]